MLLCLFNTKIRINLQCQIKQHRNKKKRDQIELTEKEEELIRAIHNYRMSFLNRHPQMLYYIQQLVDELTDLP